MTIRAQWFALFIAAALMFAQAEEVSVRRGTSPPNILVMICDDLGYGDLASYGHPHIRTPNLDALADDGIRYTAFYSAAPVCSPSRVGLLTGRSPNRAGVYDWIPPDRGPRPDGRDRVHLRRGEVTIAMRLAAAGYQTAMIGKWHANSRFNDPSQPQIADFGFDHYLATGNNASPSHDSPNNFVRNGEPVGRLEGFSCRIVAREATEYLRSIDDNRPFFLYVAFHEPHEPVASPPEMVDAYADAASSQDEARYFANVENMDAAVGELLSYLDASGKREETLIVFTSDNGPETLNRYPGAERSFGRPGPLRGMKLHTTDGGVRVPGIVSFPGRVPARRQVDTPVSALDLMPTLCALAGVDPPDRPLDGVDLRPTWNGKPLHRDEPLIWAYYNAINEHRVAMRNGRFKVLARIDGDLKRFSNVTEDQLGDLRLHRLVDFEVYDVRDDLGETTNLVEAHPELVERLRLGYAKLVADSKGW